MTDTVPSSTTSTDAADTSETTSSHSPLTSSEVPPPSLTWELRKLPSFWQSGQIHTVIDKLGLSDCTVDAFKKSPSNLGYVRFNTVADKMRAKPLLESYQVSGGAKPVTIVVREHADRMAVERRAKRAEKRRSRRSQRDSADAVKSGSKADGTAKKTRLKKLDQVLTPLGHLDYEEQLKVKSTDIKRLFGQFKNKLRDSKTWDSRFLRYLPSKKKKSVQNEEEQNTVSSSFRWSNLNMGVISSPKTERYRNKDILTFGVSRDKYPGLPVAGFHVGRLNESFHGHLAIVEPITEGMSEGKHLSQVTPLISQFLTEFVQCVRDKLQCEKYTVFNKREHSGVFRKLLIRTNERCQMMVRITVQTKELSSDELNALQKHFKQEFITFCEGELFERTNNKLSGLEWESYNGISDAVDPNDPSQECERMMLFGEDCFWEYLFQGSLKFQVSLDSFFQCHTQGAQKLYECVSHFVMSGVMSARMRFGDSDGWNPENTLLLDICCGTGSIGISVCHLLEKSYGFPLRKVLGLELVQSAVEDARRNAIANGVSDKCEYICGRAEDTLAEVLKRDSLDSCRAVAVLDPPRAGLHSSVLKCLRSHWPIEQIVYVSCNPQSCFQDLLRLCAPPSKRIKGRPFKVTRMVGFDLYPHTSHVEMVVCLERCRLSDLDFDFCANSKLWKGCGFHPSCKDETPPPGFKW